MKKKLLSAVLLLAVVLSFALPSLAGTAYDSVRIRDGAGLISDSDFESIETELSSLSEEYGIELLIKTEAVEGELPEDGAVNALAEDCYVETFGGQNASCVLLYTLVSEDGSEISALLVEGDAKNIFDGDRQNGLLDGMILGDGSRRFSDFASECASILATTTPTTEAPTLGTNSATAVTEDKYDESRLIDNARFLNSADYAETYSKLCEASRRHGTELFICTEKRNYEVTVSDAEAAADAFYKTLFGVSEQECVILYVIDDTAEGDCAYIFTSGTKSRAAVNNSAKDHLLNDTLAGKDKSSRFVDYIDECERLFAQYEASGKEYKAPFNWFMNILVCLLIGFVIALVVVLIMRGKLKSVRMKDNATDYAVPGSMQVTDARELYLYSTVVATPKPKDNDSSSSGGSSSHSGSGGRI